MILTFICNVDMIRSPVSCWPRKTIKDRFRSPHAGSTTAMLFFARDWNKTALPGNIHEWRSNAMKWRQIEQQPRSYVLIFNTGDELAKGLKDFATGQNLADASFKAIGALASVKLAWFDPETKKYRTSVDLKEQVELLSLVGDVAQHEGKPVVHAHAVVGRSDGATAGGHLMEAFVRPTCEVFLTESPCICPKHSTQSRASF